MELYSIKFFIERYRIDKVNMFQRLLRLLKDCLSFIIYQIVDFYAFMRNLKKIRSAQKADNMQKYIKRRKCSIFCDI